MERRMTGLKTSFVFWFFLNQVNKKIVWPYIFFLQYKRVQKLFFDPHLVNFSVTTLNLWDRMKSHLLNYSFSSISDSVTRYVFLLNKLPHGSVQNWYINNAVCRYNLPCYGKKKNFLRALGLRMLPPGSSCLIPLTTGKLLAGSTGLKKQILA